jgi:hypothetical protein
MPTGALVTVVVVPPDIIDVDAVMYTAPPESLAAFKTTEAIPAEILPVISDAEDGVKVTSPLDAANITTALFTRFPSASLSSAVTATGCPKDTLDGTFKVREGAAVVVPVPVPVPELVSRLPPHPLRQKNRAKKISSSAGRENFTLIDFIILISFL